MNTNNSIWPIDGIRVDLGVISMKKYSKLVRAPELEHHHSIKFNVIPKIFCNKEMLIYQASSWLMKWKFSWPIGSELDMWVEFFCPYLDVHRWDEVMANWESLVIRRRLLQVAAHSLNNKLHPTYWKSLFLNYHQSGFFFLTTLQLGLSIVITS